MDNYSSSLVNLSIPKEVTNPIVAAKIQEAVLAALGGTDKIIEALVHQICNKQVDPKKNGQVSSYSSDNTMSWVDYNVTKIIEDAIKTELQKQLEAGAVAVKESLIKTLQSKSGSNKIADALLQGLTEAFTGNDFKPIIKIEFDKKRPFI